MKIKNQAEIHINPKKDTFIFATWEGKIFINGPFVDLLCMSLGIISELYLEGNDKNKELLKRDLPIMIKKLAENEFDIDKVEL